MTGMAPHTIMAFVQHLLVVGCLCPFALSTQQGIRLDVLKGSKFCSWDVTKQHLYYLDMNFNTESFSGIILTRSRDTYYITRCSCSWPLLLLPTTAATPRLPPRRAQRRRHSATTCSSPSRRSNPTLCCMPTLWCMPADSQPFAGCMLLLLPAC